MEWSISILAAVAFYSRIEYLNIFRKVEDSLKSLIKIKTDLKYPEICSTNQLHPKFVNFILYDVTAEYEEETVSFKEVYFIGKCQISAMH